MQIGSLTFAELTDNRGAASLRKGSKTARTSQKASERLSVKVIYFCLGGMERPPSCVLDGPFTCCLLSA
ncbi:hypothetical protein U2A4042580009 [Corynebacterium striatum]|nr:hypothetical protein U2A4042580009 [Corynebacterium striatum]